MNDDDARRSYLLYYLLLGTTEFAFEYILYQIVTQYEFGLE